MGKTTTKDIILLCKGWYNKQKYPTILEALKEYYRKNYCEDMEEYLNERFLFRVILTEVMMEIAKNYSDRLFGFINRYLSYNEIIFDIPDENNTNYDYQMFYRIVNFLSRLKMRGDGIVEIDTSDYFVEDLQDDRSQRFREKLEHHGNRMCLKEDII